MAGPPPWVHRHAHLNARRNARRNARLNALLASREPKGMVTADILDRQKGGLGVDAPGWSAQQSIALDLANVNLLRSGALPVPPYLLDYVL